jgi:hypothetical protein
MRSQSSMPMSKPRETAGRARISRRLAWIAASLAAGALVGFVSLELQKRRIAPLILLPAGTGALVGLVSIGAQRALGVSTSLMARGAVAAAAAVACVATQDGVAYWDYRRAYESAIALEPGLALARSAPGGFAAAGFAEFWRAQWAQSRPWWAIDAALVTLTCVGIALLVPRAESLKSWEV